MRALNPPPRLLMGAGPSNPDPRVLRAMSMSIVGQFDSTMTQYMDEVMELYRRVFRTGNPATFLVDGSARAGAEAVLVSLIEPGDRVLVPVFGRFGLLLAEICMRCGAEVILIETPWGTVFSPSQIRSAIVSHRPKLLAIVHGDTSTSMMQPLAPLGEICRDSGTLLYSDVTTSLGGNNFEMDGWMLDAASAGLQKCLAGTPGTSPVSLSDRAVEVLERRQHVEAGIRLPSDLERGVCIQSNYFDLGMVLAYWTGRRLNHHTQASTMLYGARECAGILLEEGLERAAGRHLLHGRAMAHGIAALGLRLFGEPEFRMSNLLIVQIPFGVDDRAFRSDMIRDFGIEIGAGLGQLAGRVWRIGVMGYNARRDAVLLTLSALEHVLRRYGARPDASAGVEAALDVYRISTYDA